MTVKREGYMAYLRIYVGNRLLEQRELSAERTTIGRAVDNDIVLPSNGVSKHHATIEKAGQSFVLVDNNSANGVYVNGERIQRHTLRFWDEIQIFDWVVRFMASRALPGDETGMADQPGASRNRDATVAFDISSLGDLAELRKKAEVASLALFDAGREVRRYALDRVNFTIGKGRNCDVRLSGWLAPRLAATIQRRADSFVLIPVRRGKVSVDGIPVREPVKLTDDNNLKVRGVALKFYFRPAEDT
jgi:predicted component of type VI protein secretion system